MEPPICICNSSKPMIGISLKLSWLQLTGSSNRFPTRATTTATTTRSFSASKPFKLSCNYGGHSGDGDLPTTDWAYRVLGLDSNCSSAQLKDGFRTKVKQFHPDVVGSDQKSDFMIRHIIQAYEILSNLSKSEIIERDYMDPFDKPECEAFDVFVNEVLCIGKAHDEDYRVQSAVGQCPRSCIHYVTPSQRIVLEELLGSILSMPYDTSAEAELLYSLIVKASYENNRFQIPKKKAKESNKHVDWY